MLHFMQKVEVPVCAECNWRILMRVQVTLTRRTLTAVVSFAIRNVNVEEVHVKCQFSIYQSTLRKLPCLNVNIRTVSKEQKLLLNELLVDHQQFLPGQCESYFLPPECCTGFTAMLIRTVLKKCNHFQNRGCFTSSVQERTCNRNFVYDLKCIRRYWSRLWHCCIHCPDCIFRLT